jgi:hypothetical protein
MVQLALARALGQTGALEAGVEARALWFGLGRPTGLGRCHASPVGCLTIFPETTDRRMVSRDPGVITALLS